MDDKLIRLEFPDGTHNTENLYIKNNILYKVFIDTNIFIKEKERNIDFLISNKIPNTPTIYNKIIKDSKFVGYIMEYIPETITFRRAINNNIPIELKFKAINDVYESLKFLNQQNIFLGDIHLDNLLISKDGHGYIVDLEELRFPGDEFKFKQCYLVKPNNEEFKLNIPTSYTDNAKLMLSSLSLLLNQDLEKYISKTSDDINLEEIYNSVILPIGDINLNKYFKSLMTKTTDEFFSDYIFNNHGYSKIRK